MWRRVALPPPLGITGKLLGTDSSGTGYKTISTTSFSILLDKGTLTPQRLRGLWDASLYYIFKLLMNSCLESKDFVLWMSHLDDGVFLQLKCSLPHKTSQQFISKTQKNILRYLCILLTMLKTHLYYIPSFSLPPMSWNIRKKIA